MIKIPFITAAVLLATIFAGCTADSKPTPISSSTPGASSMSRASSSSVNNTMSSLSSSAIPIVSSSASSMPAIEGCASDIAAGKDAYAIGCQGCHGEVPSNGGTLWTAKNRTIDVFDSTSDGYKPRGGGAPQMMAFGDFIALYMPTMAAGVGQPTGDQIAAYIADKVKQPWCPGEQWPDPQPAPASSASNSSTASIFPLPVGQVTTSNAVGVGPFAGCLIDQDSKAQCWGGNFMIPNNATCRLSPAKWGQGICVSRAVAPNDLGKIVAIRGVHEGACAILKTPKNGKNIRCWGAQGRLGDHHPSWNNAVSLTGGNHHVCALRATGEVACWGTKNASEPFPTPPNNLKAKAIASTHEAACAIRDNDSVICWGKNIDAPPSGLKAKKITVGGTDINNVPTHHACALNMNNTAVCWGQGPGANAPNNLKAKDIAASADASCVVLMNGQTRCWGELNDIEKDGGSKVAANANKGPAGNNYKAVYASRYTMTFTKNNGSVVRYRDYNIRKKLAETPATGATDIPANIKVINTP